MVPYTGPGGFEGNELEPGGERVPISERHSILWDFCEKLENKGFVVDTKGYSTCFRVNLKHQTSVSKEQFDGLKNSDLPEGLSSSINLGNIDIYPSVSGKKNW